MKDAWDPLFLSAPCVNSSSLYFSCLPSATSTSSLPIPALPSTSVPLVETQKQFNYRRQWGAAISHVWVHVGRQIASMCLSSRESKCVIHWSAGLVSSVESVARTKIYGLDFLLPPYSPSSHSLSLSPSHRGCVTIESSWLGCKFLARSDWVTVSIQCWVLWEILPQW